jgi:hypothetical protein
MWSRSGGAGAGGQNPSMERAVKKLAKPRPTIEGAGVHLRRACGFGNTSETDPFLLLDDFRNDDPVMYASGFPATRVTVQAGDQDAGFLLVSSQALAELEDGTFLGPGARSRFRQKS